MQPNLKVIIDFDGTLTAEETQVEALAEKSLGTLADEILGLPREVLVEEYKRTQARLLREPYRYWWEVNGLVASYCDEGAFILNTTTLQIMLQDNPAYARAIAEAFPQSEYEPVADCTNYLFHRNTAALPPCFRPAARNVLAKLAHHPNYTPLVLTNSLGDKVYKHLSTLELDTEIEVLGDTRQYEMIPLWPHHFPHAELGMIQIWPVDEKHPVDLRRPAYYRALVEAASDGSRLAVVADTFSLPGAVPLMMDVPFFLLRTSYTPAWCVRVVAEHPRGQILDDLAHLPGALDALPLHMDPAA